LCYALANIKEALCKLCAQTLQHLTLTQLKTDLTATFAKNLSLQRFLVQKLLSKGILFSSAEKAINDLAQYCAKNQCEPDNLIASEILKIHRDLPNDFGETYREATQELATVKQAATDKQRILERRTHLGKVLEQVIL